MSVIQILRKYGYALWLGMALQASGITITDWQLYFIAIPLIILAEWGHWERGEHEPD